MLDYPFSRAHCLAPMPHLDLLDLDRMPRVAMPSGHPAHLAVRHADVVQALSDPRLSRRAMLTAPGGPRFTLADMDEPSLVGLDPPDHSRVRRLCAPAFRPARLREAHDRVQDLTGRLLDGLAKGSEPVDLHGGLSVPLATETVCDLLGVPSGDRTRLRHWARQKLSLTGLAPDQARAGHQALRDHFARLVAEPAAPGLVASLTESHHAGRLSRPELIATLVNLFVAGHATTSAVLTNGLLCLLTHRAQWTALTLDPGLTGPAVTEILRYDAAADMGLPRLATADLRIGTTDVRAGEAVIPAHAYADRDPAVFPDPDVFDITRAPGPHLAFGHGPHFCVGARLATLVMGTALRSLAGRFPHVELAVPARSLPWSNGSLTGGVTRLPVRL